MSNAECRVSKTQGFTALSAGQLHVRCTNGSKWGSSCNHGEHTAVQHAALALYGTVSNGSIAMTPEKWW